MNRFGRKILVAGLALCLAAPVLPGTMTVRATEAAQIAETESAPTEAEITAAKERLMGLLDDYSGEKIKQLVSDAVKQINQKEDMTSAWLENLIAVTEEQAKIWGEEIPTTPSSTEQPSTPPSSGSGSSSGSSSSGSFDSDDYIDF